MVYSWSSLGVTGLPDNFPIQQNECCFVKQSFKLNKTTNLIVE